MDQRDPRNPLYRGMGDIPAEHRGQAPGLQGAPDREQYLEQHTLGYPQMPDPPVVAGMTPAQVQANVALWVHIAAGVLKDRFSADVVASITQGWARRYWRPVHQPPWVNAPFRAVPMGQVSAYAGTAIPSGAGTWTTIVSDTVPTGSQGVIRWVGHAVAAAGDWANLHWRIVHGVGPNLAPYRQPFATWDHQIGQIEAPTNVEALIVQEGETVALQANQASGSEIAGAMGLLRGWFWPRTGGVSDGSTGSIVS